ncbi:hypothetical protein BS78_04G032900 [Paspalum vaginatum]|nr:hypothetical protein BS78_04G032900 [Paspalum vaginatum]
MEPDPDASWVPCEFQLSNWTMETVAWTPGFPVSSSSLSESNEIFGTPSWMQTCVPNNSSGGQLVEYYAAASEHDPIEKESSFEVELHNMQMQIHSSPIRVFEDVAHKFEADIDMIKVKMHRYPTVIRDLGVRNTVPRIVAIGPYHHNRQELKQTEQAKHVAAYHCLRQSGRSVEELYSAVVSVADDARRLYDKDVMAGIGYEDFRHMMFFDACFLVQYMVWYTDISDKEMDPSLRTFFFSNRSDINHDVLLLENQLPWQVVKTVMRFRPLPLDKFVAPWTTLLQDRHDVKKRPFALDGTYQPPHLLGLLRFYIVGRSDAKLLPKKVAKIRSLSFSVSAIELAEIGITLTANETAELVNMGLNKKGVFFAELSLAPLSLDYARASRLLNMAAFELCTVPNFLDGRVEDSAVCSYLRLLSMLVHREEDVHQLRRKGILQGGAGLTNKEALDFFTSLQSLPGGFCYTRTMVEIESYRVNRSMRTKAHAFFHKKKTTICTVLSTIVAVVSIFGTLVGILVKLKTAP